MASIWDDFSGMPEALEKVSGIIKDSLVSKSPIISDGLSGLLDGGGKLLRPGLLIIAGRFGKFQEKHYKLAAALEMLHMATLVHDDVIDDSPLRRGLPSLHCRYGKKDAVLMGDFLLSRCFLLAAEHTSPKNALNLAHAISVLCTMEIEQNNDRYKTNSSLRSYLRKIMGKSALLFSLACFTGAHEAGLRGDICQRLRRLGYNIGIAFQIIDDILDYSGKQELVRKSLGNDIAAGLVTLPVICALRTGESGVLKDIFSRANFTQEEACAIFTQVQSSGGVEAATMYASVYTNRALRDIATLPPGENRDILETLTKRLLVRQE
jgi:heptaprenyl diphosphate synthase